MSFELKDLNERTNPVLNGRQKNVLIYSKIEMKWRRLYWHNRQLTATIYLRRY